MFETESGAQVVEDLFTNFLKNNMGFQQWLIWMKPDSVLEFTFISTCVVTTQCLTQKIEKSCAGKMTVINVPKHLKYHLMLALQLLARCPRSQTFYKNQLTYNPRFLPFWISDIQYTWKQL